MNQCSRCLKNTDGIHTCTPTKEWRDMEVEIAELKSRNNFDAARLRRLVSFCGVAAPDSDEELLQVAGVVIGSCLRVLQSPSSMIDPHSEIGVLKHHLSSKNKQLSEANTRMAMMEEALKKIISNPSVNHIHANGDISYLESALSTFPESLKKWEAEKLEPLQKEVAMLVNAIESYGHDFFCKELKLVNGGICTCRAHNKLTSVVYGTQAAAEAFMREERAKAKAEVLEEVAPEVFDEFPLRDRVHIINALRRHAREIRATNKE